MRPTLAWAAIVIVAVIAGPSAQQTSADRFRFERTIVTNGSGPRRLAIDVPLLVGAEPYFGRDARHAGDRPPTGRRCFHWHARKKRAGSKRISTPP